MPPSNRGSALEGSLAYLLGHRPLLDGRQLVNNPSANLSASRYAVCVCLRGLQMPRNYLALFSACFIALRLITPVAA